VFGVILNAIFYCVLYASEGKTMFHADSEASEAEFAEGLREKEGKENKDFDFSMSVAI